MQARCRLRYSDQNQDIVDNDGWLGYLNDAYRDVISASPLWPFNTQPNGELILTAGSRSVDLPPNTFRIAAVYNDTNQWPMAPIEGRTQQIVRYPDQTITGPPRRYRIINNQMQVWPLPEIDTTFVVDYFSAPPDLGSMVLTTSAFAGDVAGDHTLSGIDLSDTIVAVTAVDDSTHAATDLTAEFAITAPDTVSNFAGTDTTGAHVVVTYNHQGAGNDTPVFPAQWHNILVQGALAYAYTDDANPTQAAVYQAKFDGMLIKMIADLLSGQQDRNTEIVDDWYSR